MPELWTDEFSQARDWLRRAQRLTQDQMLIPLRGGPSVARRSRTRDCAAGRVSVSSREPTWGTPASKGRNRFSRLAAEGTRNGDIQRDISVVCGI
jgi:hypothetical protein